jgi:curved DNA-binding protein CbpA
VRTDRDYYRILGIDRQATSDQVKQRYRELVRQHHPDVNPNQHAGMGHNTFLQIVEAYQILSDPEKRTEYDRIWERRSAGATSAKPGTPTAPSGGAVIDNLLQEAQKYFEARNLQETDRTCRRILQLDKENAPAYELMGDVKAGQKRNEEALSYYTMAQQFYGGRKPEITAKIERLMKKEEQLLHEAIHGKPVYKRAPAMAVIFTTLIMLTCWGLSTREGSRIQGFALFSQTPLNLLLFFWADAFLLGAVLAGSGLLERFDDEMLFDLGARGTSANTPPLGLFMPVISIINFYLAVVTFFIYSFMHERFSVSVLKAALALLLLALAFAAPHPDALAQTLLFGTGPGFAIMCVGWLLSDMLRPHW